MKKRTLVLGLAALCLSFGSMAILGGVSSNIGNNTIVTKAEEEATSDSLVFTSAYKENDCNSANGVAWAVSSDASQSNFETTRGIHYGTSSASVGYITLTSTTAYSQTISKITVNAANGSTTGTTVSVTVGGEDFGTAVSLPNGGTTGTDCVFTGNASGVVVVSVKKSSSTKKALYVKSITIEFVTTTPSISIDGEADVILKAGDTKTVNLKTANIPEGGSVSVESGNTSIATAAYDDSGAITIVGLATGNTTYTASIKDSSGAVVKSVTGNIEVSTAIDGISISSTFTDGGTLKVGQTYNINVAVTPDGASTSVTWEISDAKAASISDEGVLTILKKNSDELVTLTAKSAVDSTKTAMLTFYVDNEFDIADLISQDGTTAPNGLISGSSEVVTHGTVTAIDKTLSTPSIYLQSGESALIISTAKSDFTSLPIGSGLKVSGKFKLESGVTKLTSPEIVDQGASYNDATVMELSSDNMVAKNTNRIATATGCTATSSSSIEANLALESPANLSIGFTLKDSPETSYVLYIKKAAQQSALDQFGDIEEGIAYDVKGIYSLYNGTTQEIVFTEGASYYNTKLTDFIATYITPYSGDPQTGDSCKTKYENAKAVLDGLTEATQNTFKTATAYNSAYEIYRYWEINQTSVSTAKLVANSNTSDWGNAALIAGAFILVGGATFFFIHNNRKKQDR